MVSTEDVKKYLSSRKAIDDHAVIIAGREVPHPLLREELALCTGKWKRIRKYTLRRHDASHTYRDFVNSGAPGMVFAVNTGEDDSLDFPKIHVRFASIRDLIIRSMYSMIALHNEGGYVEHDLCWEMFDHIANLPQVKDGEGDVEDLDFENATLLSIDVGSNSVVIAAGGDWQEPKTFTATLGSDRLLHCSDEFDGYDDRGLPYAKILEILYGNVSAAPKVLQDASFR